MANAPANMPAKSSEGAVNSYIGNASVPATLCTAAAVEGELILKSFSAWTGFQAKVRQASIEARTSIRLGRLIRRHEEPRIGCISEYRR